MTRERLKVVKSHQNSNANPIRHEIEFEANDFVIVKVTPRRGVTRFRFKGKLDQRYIGPFKILKRIGNVSYHLNLPPQVGHVYDVFHIFLV